MFLYLRQIHTSQNIVQNPKYILVKNSTRILGNYTCQISLGQIPAFLGRIHASLCIFYTSILLCKDNVVKLSITGVLKCFQLWARFHIPIFLLGHHYEGYKWISTL